MKEQLLQEAYDNFRLSLGQEPQPMSPKAMEYFCEAMDKYVGVKNIELVEKTNNLAANVYDVVHYFNIKVINNKREIVEFLSWNGMKWELRLKYDWYFKYRAALLQIKYPKYEVIIIFGNEPAVGKTLEQIRQNKIKSKKSKITEYKNKLEKAKLNWSSLFPIEDDEDYKRAVEKIAKLEFELRNI